MTYFNNICAIHMISIIIIRNSDNDNFFLSIVNYRRSTMLSKRFGVGIICIITCDYDSKFPAILTFSETEENIKTR